MVDDFLDSVHEVFVPKNNIVDKFQAYFEIVNQQRVTDHNDFNADKRNWLTNVFQFKYFNDFVQGEIKNETMKRIISNGQSGSSWYFKRFERLNIIVVPLINEIKLITG